MVRFKNIIFDLDGTLIDSSPDIIQCLQNAYSRAAMPDVEITRYHIGPKLEMLINTLTPEIDHSTKQKVIANYRDIYDNLENKQTILYDAVFDSLKKLKDLGCSLFIATNKPHTATIPLLKHFKIDTLFKAVLTPTSVEGRDLNKTEMVSNIIETYHLNKQESVMVGDHHDDIVAAKHNGIASVAVLYGYSHQDKMKQANADYQINSFSEFLIL